MKMNSKILAVAVVAMFIATAFACAVSDDDDAADKNYRLYVEIMDDKGKVAYSTWISTSGDSSVRGYIAAMNDEYVNAVKDSGLKSVGNIDKYNINDSWGGVTFSYDLDYVYSATFYEKDGKWAEVTDLANDYINSKSAAIILCPVDIFYNYFYLEKLPVGADANNYVKGDYGFMYLPNESPKGFESPIMMYVIIILAIVAVVAIIAIAVKGKKKKTI